MSESIAQQLASGGLMRSDVMPPAPKMPANWEAAVPPKGTKVNGYRTGKTGKMLAKFWTRWENDAVSVPLPALMRRSTFRGRPCLEALVQIGVSDTFPIRVFGAIDSIPLDRASVVTGKVTIRKAREDGKIYGSISVELEEAQPQATRMVVIHRRAIGSETPGQVYGLSLHGGTIDVADIAGAAKPFDALPKG